MNKPPNQTNLITDKSEEGFNIFDIIFFSWEKKFKYILIFTILSLSSFYFLAQRESTSYLLNIKLSAPNYDDIIQYSDYDAKFKVIVGKPGEELDIFTYKLLKDNFKDIFQNNRLLHKAFLEAYGHDEKIKDEDVDINIDNDDDDDDNSAEPEPNGKNGKKKKPMPPKKDNGEEEEQEVEEPKDDGDDVEVKDKEKDKDKKKTSGNSGEKKAEISKIGEDLQRFTTFLNELMAVDAVGKKKKEKDGKEPDAEYGDQTDTPDGEKDFVDAHGKKEVAVDVDDAIKQTTKTAQDTKQGKHVKGQTAKGDKNIIKSTEAPVKDKEVKDGEGKKSVKTEAYHGDKKKKDDKEKSLMDMALAALKGKTVPEMRNIIASKEPTKNPFDARTRDAKAFLERMAKRKNGNGNGGQYKDKDPKDLPMIKGEKDNGK